jgi:hypothetical protein
MPLSAAPGGTAAEVAYVEQAIRTLRGLAASEAFNAGASYDALALLLERLAPPAPSADARSGASSVASGSGSGSGSGGPQLLSVTWTLIGHRTRPSLLVAAAFLFRYSAAGASSDTRPQQREAAAAVEEAFAYLPLVSDALLCVAEGRPWAGDEATGPDLGAVHSPQPEPLPLLSAEAARAERAAVARRVVRKALDPATNGVTPSRMERWWALGAFLALAARHCGPCAASETQMPTPATPPALAPFLRLESATTDADASVSGDASLALAPKLAFDIKSLMYPIVRCPLLASVAFDGLVDPLLGAWLLAPDDVSLGIVRPLGQSLQMQPQQQQWQGVDSVSSLPPSAPVPAAASKNDEIPLGALLQGYNLRLDSGPDGPGLHVFTHLRLVTRVVDYQAPYLRRAALLPVLRLQEAPLAVVLAAMETTGVPAHPQALQDTAASAVAKRDAITRECQRIVGRGDFNPGSAQQVAQFLFQEAGLTAPKRGPELHNKHARKGDKRHESADEETLKAMSSQHPLPALVLTYRRINKLTTAFCEPLSKASVTAYTSSNPMDVLLPNGLGRADMQTRRICTCLSQIRTGTGRLSSRNPNLQTLPASAAKAEELQDLLGDAFVSVRSIVRASGPDCVLLSLDYAQIEIRVLAHLSGDPHLRSHFAKRQPGTAEPKVDIYKEMASRAFRKPASAVSDSERASAKQIVLGLMYGRGIQDLAAQLQCSEGNARRIKEDFLRAYPGIQSFATKARDFARDYGHVPIWPTGRRRTIESIHDADHVKASYGTYIHMNTPVCCIG